MLKCHKCHKLVHVIVMSEPYRYKEVITRSKDSFSYLQFQGGSFAGRDTGEDPQSMILP